MPQETNLNVNPYFDDFDKDKNFYKVLFKPGTPVQARELSTLQSILQNQIEQFGTHFFKEGSKVIPGNLTYDNNFQCIQIEDTFLGIPVELYADQLKGIRITGGRSGVTATIKTVLTTDQSINGNLTLYVKYEKSGAEDFSQEKFLDGESLITGSDLVYGVSVISTNEPFANTLAFGASATGSAMSIGEGVYFVRGSFVQVKSETLILDQYSNTPSYRVGFDIDETFVTADEDSSLNDNASGFTNYAAPGADRLKIDVSLGKKTLDDTNDQNFIEIARIENGFMQAFVKDVQYNIIRDTLAARTYDESGDYYVKPFEIFAKESLNDSVGNKGVYTAEQKTQQGSTPSDDLMLLQISPGKAYVKGYELEKISTSFIDVEKPRTTREIKDHSIFYETGNPLFVNNIYGSPALGIGTTATVALHNSRRGGTTGLTGGAGDLGEEIGLARLYDFKAQSSSYVNQTTQYEARLFDVKTYTKVTVGTAITSVTAGDSIEGARSGAFGFAVATASNATSFKLTDVNGTFIKDEQIIINGARNGRVITKVDDWGFNDVKSLRSYVGVSTFQADVLIGNSVSLNNQVSANLELSRVGTTGNTGIITASGNNFVGIITTNNIVSYTVPGKNDPSFAIVTGIATDGTSINISGITTVTGVCDGGIPPSTRLLNDLAIRHTTFKAGQNSFLTPLGHKHIESVDVTTTTLQFRKQYDNIAFSGNQFTSPNAGADYYFQPFDEERYLISYDDGSVEPLTTSQVEVSDDKKTVTFVALSKASGKANLYATVLKGDIKTKLKNVNDANVINIINSNDASSGVGTNTKNDGLTFSTIYGTRVQDDKISLNVPECVALVGVFESNDTGDAELPSLTLTAYSGPSGNNNDFIVGEQLVGKNSNAVGLFCERPNTTTCGFVRLNRTEFQIGEPVIGQKSGVQGTVVNSTNGDRDVSNQYMLNCNDKPTYYDFSYIKRKRGIEAPTNKLKVVFKNFYVDGGDEGDFYTATSYPKSAFDLIPDNQGYQVKTSSLVDIRPRVSPYNTSSTTSPFDFRSRNFSGVNNINDPLVPDEALIISYNYYQGRKDRLYLDKNANWVYIKGVPADVPGLPNAVGDSLEICTVELPAYTHTIKQVKITRTPHKRFTMADIGRLETRIKNVEYYTRLSLLETDTANLNITDANGLSRFKSGFFVDNFKTHGSHQIAHPDWSASTDSKSGSLRPGHYTTAVDMVVGSKSYVGIGTSANPNVDLAFANDIDGENVRKTGKLVTLDYEEVPMLKQIYASRVENVNPFLIVYYAGDMSISPDSDTWMDTKRLDANVIQDTTSYDQVAAQYGIDEQTGLSEVDWGVWEQQWTSEKIVNTFTQVEEQVFDKVHPSELPEGVVLDVKHIADYGKVIELNGKWVPKGAGWITDAKLQKKTEFQDVAQMSHQSRQGIQYQISSTYNEESLGDRVLSRDIIPYCRSRSIEVTLNRMKPRTQFYVFFDNVDVTKYCTPKLLEIEMVHGQFQIGERVRGHHQPISLYTNRHTDWRIAAPNHKEGPYDAPTKVVTLNPYDNAAGVPASYSTGSTLLNIDTASLADMSEPSYYGFGSEGMRLNGVTSGAYAKCVRNRLITDTLGNLKFTFMIPDPNDEDNPQFETGTKTLRVTTSPTNSTVAGTVTGSAEANYYAKGELETVQENVLSIKVPHIERLTPEEQQVVQGRIETRVNPDASDRDFSAVGADGGPVVITGVQYYDPLAQTFRVDDETGVYLTSVDVFLRDKDEEIPLTLQVRTVETGLPTSKILPFAIKVKDPSEVNVSEDASIATNFQFESPVYLSGGHEYALVLVTPAENYNCWISRMGEVDISTANLPDEQQVLISQQPYLGSLFKSQNGTTWDPSQYEDMKFNLYKAKFNIGPSVARWFNPSLDHGNGQLPKLVNNPITALSRKAIVGITSTFTEYTGLVPGVNISQAGNESAKATLVNIAGIATINGSNDLTIINPGVGYTPSSGHFLYRDVPVITQTGDGSGAVANVRVENGKVGVVTFTNGGKNFAVGDTVGLGTLGLGNGSGAVVSVGLITAYNTLVLDEIQGSFNIGVGTVMFDNGSAVIGLDGKTGIGSTVDGQIGSAHTISSFDVDQTNDGLHFRVAHRAHSMHAFNNLVTLDLIQSDVPSTSLTADYVFNNTNEINVTSSSNFATFEGVGVGTTNYGLAKIGDEIISYTGVANGQIVGITTRGMFGTLIEDHDSGDPIVKYEFAGVSLARINKTHDLANEASASVPNDKGLDFYHIKVDFNKNGTDRSGSSFPNLYFNTTKRGGGNDCEATQNIQFETITPNVQTMTPPGTNVGARIRTTSATSIDGTELSFADEGYENLQLGSQNHFDTPRMIASQINEDNKIGAEIPAKKSLTMELLLSSNNINVSPAIDIDRVSNVLTTNRLNSPVSNFASDSRVCKTGQDPCASYVSKMVVLNNPASEITVEFSAYRSPDSDIRVFYKTMTEGTVDNSLDRNWEPFPGYTNTDQFGAIINPTDNNGLSDQKVPASIGGEFRGYTYTTREIQPFTKFQIKIDMVGTNQASPPIIRELRAIALA